MSFPTLQVRPNEKNPKVLRAHEFLRQSNQLVERNLINMEGRKMLARMLTKMVAEVKCIYSLDEKRAEAGKSGKLMEKLKSAHQISLSIMEDRFVNADMGRMVQERKMDVQKKYTEIDNLRKSVQVTKAEVAREIEKNEKRHNFGVKASEELCARSSAVLKSLENSADVGKLRRMEEEKRSMEEQVEGLREHKQGLQEEIRTKRATLKAESKKSFQKTVVECAKHYKLHQTLSPKLLISQKNVESLKEEEEQRRASGSLDETILFDRSFVLASMEKEKSPVKLTPPPPPPAQKPSQVRAEEPMETEQVVEEEVAENPGEITMEHPENPENEVEMVEAPVSMETQRNVAPLEEEEPEQPEEHEKNDSMDVLEQEEEEPVFDALLAADRLKTAENSATALLKDVAARLEQEQQHKEQEEPEADGLSEHGGSNRDDENFSFNFFGNNKEGGGNEEELNSGDANFDFNFGATGSGDDASNNGSTSGGGFDFLGAGGVENDGGVSDPFGFGKSSGGGGGGGGDMSFNFNFDSANGDNENGGGAGGNSTFFNF